MNKPLKVDYGSEEGAMRAYLQQGERLAFSLGNRGPIRFGTNGKVHPDILDAYWRCGFYVFEGVLGAGNKAPTLFWSKPLGDPFGGTNAAGGRHPVKMFEPQAAADAPKEVVYLILGSLQFSDAHLRVYGHPVYWPSRRR